MVRLLLGIACAGAASTLYCLEVALQALEARAVPVEHGFRLSLLVRLVRRPRWLAANLVGTLGWPLQAAALLFAPLTVVQPALGLGLILLVPIGARLLREPVGRREAAAVLAILAGVTGIASAAPERSTAHAGASVLGPAVAALAVLALVPYLVSATRRPGLAGAWSAGFAFALSGLATKLFSDALAARAGVELLLWLALTAASAGLGVLSEMSALQRRPAAQVAPTVFAAGTLVPVALAPVVAGESWGSLRTGAALAVSLALVVAGASVLERSPSLAHLLASASSTESGVDSSPRVESIASSRSRE